MKCPNCGAEIGNNSVCEYCGAQISLEMKKEQEQINKQGCPKCGSTNIKFTRENQGEIRGKNVKQIVHRTVGFCQDCGHTWYPQSTSNEVPQKSNMVWWVLGWIFFFPAPVMVLIWRKKNTWDIKIKIAVTVVFWILMFILGSRNNTTTTTETKSNTENPVEVTETTTEDSAEKSQQVGKSKPIVKPSNSKEESVAKEETNDTEEIVVEEEDNVSKEFKNALVKAEAYATIMYMSKQAVFDQLTSEYGEHFSEDAATYAIGNLDVDWNENALKKAEEYSETMHMSKLALYDQLVSDFGEKFTPDEAQYAIDNIQADWKANALEKAKEYQETMNMSSSSIYDQLVSEYGEKFTAEEAQYAIDNLE